MATKVAMAGIAKGLKVLGILALTKTQHKARYPSSSFQVAFSRARSTFWTPLVPHLSMFATEAIICLAPCSKGGHFQNYLA